MISSESLRLLQLYASTRARDLEYIAISLAQWGVAASGSSDRPSARLRAPSTPLDAPRPRGSNDLPLVSFDAKQHLSSARTIDKAMSDGHERGSQSGIWHPTVPPRPRGNRPWRGRGESRGRPIDRHRAFRSALTCASPHARTHAREVVVVVLAVPPLPSRCASWRAVRLTSVYMMTAHAPRAAATLLVIAKSTSRVRTSARKCGRPCCCCGCGLMSCPDAGVTREVTRGSGDARTAMGVRARLGAAPRAVRNWGFVRPLLPAWPGAPAVTFLAFLTRPRGRSAPKTPGWRSVRRKVRRRGGAGVAHGLCRGGAGVAQGLHRGCAGVAHPWRMGWRRCGAGVAQV